MNGTQKGKKTSVTKEKSKEKTDINHELKKLLAKYSKHKTNQMPFYIIKYFCTNNFQKLSKESLCNYILNIYKTDKKKLVNFSDEPYKNEKGVKTAFFRLIKKSNIFISNSQNTKYELNVKEAIDYFGTQASPFTPVIKRNISPNRTPDKIKSLIKGKLSTEKPKRRKSSSVIKNEKYQFDKPDNKNDQKIKIKIEEIKVKQEKEPEEEELTSDKEDEENTNKKNKIYELFHSKIYNNFYNSFGEQGLYELLQEKIENFLDKYNKNQISNNDKFSISGIINKIRELQKEINGLNLIKEDYDKLTYELEKNKFYLLFYYHIMECDVSCIKDTDTESNEESSELLLDLNKDLKNISSTVKEKHDLVYNEFINGLKNVNTDVEKAELNKNVIKNELAEIVEFFKKNNINLDDSNNLCDLCNDFKERNNPTEKEKIDFAQQYNIILNELKV